MIDQASLSNSLLILFFVARTSSQAITVMGKTVTSRTSTRFLGTRKKLKQTVIANIISSCSGSMCGSGGSVGSSSSGSSLCSSSGGFLCGSAGSFHLESVANWFSASKLLSERIVGIETDGTAGIIDTKYASI
jgi:hypothetical protein